MAYHRQNEPSGNPGGTLLALLAVVFAGAAVVWWWSPSLGIDLSGVDRLAGLVGMGQTGRTDVAAEVAPAPETAAGVPVAAASPTVAAAPFCAPGQAATFVLGFADLKAAVGDPMGDPVECEHPNPDNGDSLQRTTTGLAVYSKAANRAAFTDGWRHWALTPQGLVAWEGDEPNPPPTAQATPTMAAGERMRVVNTDGLGLILRSAPREDARLPRGLAEGAVVTVLERSGSEWLRVHADNGQEGWVPAKYLARAS